MAALSAIKDRQERFAWLVERGKSQPALAAPYKTDLYRVEGCLAKLWVVGEFRDGRCYFQADADSLIVKSIAALLCEFYSGGTPREILEQDPAFLARFGITQHLTPNRRNSLSKVLEQIRGFASQRAETSGSRG